MSLPEKYRTARLKSLPQGLQAQAEAIIKKKFSIKEEKPVKKATVGNKTFIANGIDPIVSIDFAAIPWDQTVTINSRPVLRLREIRYEFENRTYDVAVECRSCGALQRNRVHASQVEGKGYDRTYTCRCGQETFFIQDNDFYHAYQDGMRRKSADVWMRGGGNWF